jgi:hypothetical protein
MTKNEMMEKWWSSVLEEEEHHVRHKSEKEAEDKHRRVEMLRSIMDGRIAINNPLERIIRA